MQKRQNTKRRPTNERNSKKGVVAVLKLNAQSCIFTIFIVKNFLLEWISSIGLFLANSCILEIFIVKNLLLAWISSIGLKFLAIPVFDNFDFQQQLTSRRQVIPATSCKEPFTTFLAKDKPAVFAFYTLCTHLYTLCTHFYTLCTHFYTHWHTLYTL